MGQVAYTLLEWWAAARAAFFVGSAPVDYGRSSVRGRSQGSGRRVGRRECGGGLLAGQAERAGLSMASCRL